MSKRKMKTKVNNDPWGPSQYLSMVFHMAVVLYYIVVNLFMIMTSFQLYSSGHEITTMFLGGIFQFFSTWTQMLQQLYFTISLIDDSISLSGNKNLSSQRSEIAQCKNSMFIPLVVPSACLTVVNFWSIYTLVPHLMMEDLVAALPEWLNHAMHTNVLALVLLELLITPKQTPPSGFTDLTMLMATYCSWVYFMGAVFSQWAYPFLRVMNFSQHIVFIPCMFLHGYFWFFVASQLARFRWGDSAPIVEEERPKLR